MYYNSALIYYSLSVNVIIMNEFLEQLVKGPTTACRQKSDRPGERGITWIPNQQTFLCLFCSWESNANKLPYLIICLSMRCLSLISVFFMHPLHDVLARTRDNSKRRGQIPGPCQATVQPMRLDLLNPNHQCSLPAASHADLLSISSGGLFQEWCSSICVHSILSEDVERSWCNHLHGTKKANSVARVVVKPTRDCVSVC